MKNRKVYLWFISVLLFGFLIGGIPISPSANASSTSSLVSNEIMYLKQKTLKGFDIEDVKSVYFMGKSIPEILVSYAQLNESNYTYNTYLKTYQYRSKKWVEISSNYYKNQDAPYSYITKGKLLDSKKEQVVLGTIEGSGGFLYPFLYGSSNGKTVGKLKTFSNGYFDGGAVIKNKKLYFLQNTIVADKVHYEKGKYYIQPGTGADDRIVASGANKFIYLSKKNGKTVSSITSNTIHLKVGDKLAIVRKSTADSSSYVYRILYFTEHPILDYSNTYMTAKKAGKEVWQFEPEAYEDAQKVTLTVTK